MTYEDILQTLLKMTPEQRQQRAQLAPATYADGVLGLQPVIALNTVAYFEYDKTRSSYDNQHHPEDFVFLTDWNPFFEDGAIAEDLLTGERIFPNADFSNDSNTDASSEGA